MPQARRKRALAYFYAYCRLVDDIVDCLSIPEASRKKALEEILQWIENPNSTKHPFWTLFQGMVKDFEIPKSCLLGILDGVAKDIHTSGDKLHFQNWNELNAYVQGVACDVGEGVLCILGANGPAKKSYAQNMGRCVQYLNIMRDLEEDYQNSRIYFPLEALESLGIPQDRILEEKNLEKIRQELFRRAMEFRKQAKKYSWRCIPAELMVNLYVEASKKFWRFGNSKRLNKWDKLCLSSKILLQSLLAF